MTGHDWRRASNPQAMLEFLRGRASDRKLRLFAVACMLARWHALYPDDQEIVEIVADDLDGVASVDDVAWARAAAVFQPSPPGEATVRGPLRTYECAGLFANSGWEAASETASRVIDRIQHFLDMRKALRRKTTMHCRDYPPYVMGRQAALLRDVFGNVFWPGTIHTAWRASNVVALAGTIYADRAFVSLPILADALEDAGCTDRAILDHCRQPGMHVRGCWVVDLILGKS